MQQYRHLSQTIKNCDPHKQLLRDLETEIWNEKSMHSSIIVLGDFNEDFNDIEPDGLNKFIHTCELTHFFREKKNMISSTHGNARAIDHVFVGHDIIPMARQVSMVPEEVGFASDHCGLFIDLSPDVTSLSAVEGWKRGMCYSEAVYTSQFLEYHFKVSLKAIQVEIGSAEQFISLYAQK